MFSSQAEQEIALEKSYISFGSSIVLAVLTLLLVWFGIYPEDILDLIRKLVSTLV
jgi:NADH:ubiquinone oxidoreductase subunit 4 (subunit M)